MESRRQFAAGPDSSSTVVAPETGAAALVSSCARHVLVVEDAPSLQKLLATVLRKCGHDVAVVGSGQEAVDLVAAERFDIVLMDIQMPGMSGLEATRTIRSREIGTGQHVPIVAISAHALTGDIHACRAAGTDEFLAKPVDLVELTALIQRLTT